VRKRVNAVRLSAIIITKNEAENIAECLKSLSFADECIVVDSGSSDETVTIAREYTSKVFITDWKGYAATKQFALEKAKGDWILWLDADERVPTSLANEILLTVDGHPVQSGFQIPRKAFFLGRWIHHSGWYPGYVIRLFRRIYGQFGDELVHESLKVDGPIGTLKEPILHYTDKTIYHYFRKLNRYTTLAAEDLRDRSRKVTLLGVFFRPVFMFFKMYFIKAGFLDGIQGFLLAVFSSSYVFVKYTKLWEHQTAKVQIPQEK
jgi:glycosyltransferase involved in cell wall biosynthesis